MVKYYRQYKERAIIDVSSDDLTTYETKKYDSSFDTSKLFNASKMPNFQNTIDDVGNNIIYFSFDTVPTYGGTLANNTTHVNYGNPLVNSDIYTNGGLIQDAGKQNEFQYQWTDTATVADDYIKLDIGTFGFRADNNNVDDTGFSVCFWFMCNDTTKKNTAFQASPFLDNPGWDKAFVSILMPYDGAVYFINSDGTSSLTLANGVSTQEIFDDEMAHWVFTRRNIDAAFMSLEIYKNGELLESKTVTRYDFDDNGKDIYINHSRNITAATPLDPDLDNSGTAFERFKFFNLPLTAEQVRKVYSFKPQVGSYIADSVSNKVFSVAKAEYIRDNVQDYLTDIPVSQGFGLTTVSADGYEYIEVGDAYWDFVQNTDANANMLVKTADDNMFRILSVDVLANVFPNHNQGVIYYDNGLISYAYIGNINPWAVGSQYNQNALISGIAQNGDVYNYLYVDDVQEWTGPGDVLKTPINPDVGQVYAGEIPPFPTDFNANNEYTSDTNYIRYDLDKKEDVSVWEPGLIYRRNTLILHTDDNGDTYLFKCTQGRNSSTASPPDPNTIRELKDRYSYEVVYKVTLLEDNIYVNTTGRYYTQSNQKQAITPNITAFQAYIWKVVSLPLAISKVEPTHTTGVQTYIDGITYTFIGDIKEWVKGDTYAEKEYVRVNNSTYQVVKTSGLRRFPVLPRLPHQEQRQTLKRLQETDTNI
eukprot:763106-Hanusia_phi.AAC.1